MNFEQQIEKHGYCIVDIDASVSNEKERISTQYNVVLMCHSGKAMIESNTQEITISKGDCVSLINVLSMHPISMSEDFTARIMVVERDFSIDATMGIPTEYIEQVFMKPVTKIETTIDWQLLKNCFENLYLLQQQPLSLKHYEVAATLFRTIIIILAHIEVKRNGKPLVAHYSQADVYFRQFIDLVYEHVDKEHEVIFYASKLNISPKYLSAISKQKSGRNAKDVISTFLVAHIKRDIIISGKSIKTIAYDFGFSDQSSLAKFFNKMTGQSPTAFKEQNT